jgi:hypothetical protein
MGRDTTDCEERYKRLKELPEFEADLSLCSPVDKRLPGSAGILKA